MVDSTCYEINKVRHDVFSSVTLFFIRAIIQYITVFRYQSRILTSPAVPAVDRKKVHAVPRDITLPPDDQPLAYQGTRTGKVIRSIHAGQFDFITIA